MSTIWQTYRGGQAKTLANAVTVSINSKCVINLSRAACKLIGTPEAVMMLYDDRNSVIGLVPSNERNAQAFKLKPRPDNCGYVLSATPFCRHFNIAMDQTERFDDPHVDEKGVLRLDLKRTHVIRQRNPRPKGRAGKETRGHGDAETRGRRDGETQRPDSDIGRLVG